MGCHGNRAFSHIPNRLFFEDGLVSLLIPMKICPGVHGNLN